MREAIDGSVRFGSVRLVRSLVRFGSFGELKERGKQGLRAALLLLLELRAPASEDLDNPARAARGEVIGGAPDARRVRAQFFWVEADAGARVADERAHLLDGPRAAVGVGDEGGVGVQRVPAVGGDARGEVALDRRETVNDAIALGHVKQLAFGLLLAPLGRADEALREGAAVDLADRPVADRGVPLWLEVRVPLR